MIATAAVSSIGDQSTDLFGGSALGDWYREFARGLYCLSNPLVKHFDKDVPCFGELLVGAAERCFEFFASDRFLRVLKQEVP